jgi:hypothetical protein
MTEDEVWDKARIEATAAIGKFYVGGAFGEIETPTPFPAGSYEAEEYAAAFEHFVMTALGY